MSEIVESLNAEAETVESLNASVELEVGELYPSGPQGPANVLSIGEVTTGDEANASITGESPNQVLNLVLPKGDKGEKGDKGDKGEKGDTGDISTLMKSMSVSGTSINVKDSADYVAELTVDGKAEQDSVVASPDSPSEINVIKDSVEVTSVLNLADLKDFVNGFLTVNNTLAKDDNEMSSDYIKVKPNTTYIWRCGGYNVEDTRTGEAWTGWFYYKSDKSISTASPDRKVSRTNINNYPNVTFTTSSDAEYIRIGSRGLQLSGAWAILAEESKTDTKTIDLQENFIAQLPNGVKDTLNIDKNGNVKLLKRVEKVVLNGSEDWKDDWQNSNTVDSIQFYLPSSFLNDNYICYLNTTRENALCNYFKVRDSVWSWNGGGLALNESKIYSLQVKMLLSDISDVAGFKTWLAENNVTVYYELAEPYEVDLGTLETPFKTYPTTTNISNSADTNMTLKYKKDLQTQFAEIEALLAANVQTSNIETNEEVE